MGKIQRDRQVKKTLKSSALPIAETLLKVNASISVEQLPPNRIVSVGYKSKAQKQLSAVPLATASAQPATYEKHVSKKNKLKQRKDKFKRKIDVQHNAKAQVAQLKKARKQKKTIKATSKAVRSLTLAAAADMSAMIDALPTLDDSLPSLDSLFRLKGKHVKSGIRKFDEAAAKKNAAHDGTIKKTTKKARTTAMKNDFMQRYNYFQKLSADKEFKKNPRDVIAMHIRNRRLE